MNKGKAIGVFTLAMINVAAVLSVRNFPSMAVYGWSMIFWYLLGTIMFLIPVALVGAELATGWPKEGGIYAWVTEAFGEKWGFISIWAVFAQNIVWYPTVLSFIAVTLTYAINPDLASNKIFMITVMLTVFWGATFFNFLGSKTSAQLSTVGTIAGSLIPVLLLIGLGVAYVAKSGSGNLGPLTAQSFFPTFDLSTLVFLSSIPLMFAGMEMAGYQAKNTENAQRDFPRAMFLSATVIFAASVLGTLPIAIAVPFNQLSLNGGIMQTFQIMLGDFGLTWALPIIALLVALGGIALLSTWMLGPVQGMIQVAKHGNLPKIFRDVNQHDAPTKVLVLQASIGSLFAVGMIMIPSMNAAYWALTALTTLLLCIEYLPMFAAVIKLRYSQPKTVRAYTMPGGTLGVWIIAGTGFCSIVFTFVIGTLPPQGMNIPVWIYTPAMLIGLALMAGWPLIFLRIRKPSWRVIPASDQTVSQTSAQNAKPQAQRKTKRTSTGRK